MVEENCIITPEYNSNKCAVCWYIKIIHNPPPHPLGHEIYNLVNLPLVIITIYSDCLTYAYGVEKKILKEIMHFHYMTYLAMS